MTDRELDYEVALALGWKVRWGPFWLNRQGKHQTIGCPFFSTQPGFFPVFIKPEIERRGLIVAYLRELRAIVDVDSPVLTGQIWPWLVHNASIREQMLAFVRAVGMDDQLSTQSTITGRAVRGR